MFDEKCNGFLVGLQKLNFAVAISSGIYSSFFQMGVCLGYPPVVIAQLRQENVTITGEQASWFSSTPLYAAIPWSFLLPWLSIYIGMRLNFAIVASCSLIGFIIFGLSYSLTQLFISSSIRGVLFAALITMAIYIIFDYATTISPDYREIFSTIKSASVHLDIWVGNALGTFCHWKTIGMLGTACELFNLVTVIIWPESPCWLANKDRYKQCHQAHRYKGSSLKAEEKLENLISSNKTAANNNAEHNLSKVKVTINDSRSKEWYKPVLLSFLLVIVLQISGKYALDILHMITGSQTTAYARMLILNGASVIEMHIGSFLTRYFKRSIISLYFYLIKLEMSMEISYVFITLLSIYILSMCCGPMLLSTANGELLPLKGRTVTTVVMASVLHIMIGLLIKIPPDIFKNLELHDGFLTNAIAAFIPYLVHLKYLPETKNKALIEIDTYFKEKSSKHDESQPIESILASASRALPE